MKIPKLNSKNKRGLFFEIGFILSLAFVLLAFEWRVDVNETVWSDSQKEITAEEETIQITKPEEEEDKTDVFVIVEDMPVFPGGKLELQKWVDSSIKYPATAMEKGIEGRVFVTFIIDKTGKVTHARLLRSVEPSLDEEALRIINSMPNWKPGMQRGKPVRVSYTMPINFHITKS